MCLCLGYKTPFVAKNDITVYKYVNENNGKYYTACRNYPVNTNEILKANKKDNIVLGCYNKYRIEDGAIHACTTTYDNGFDDKTCLKAIIKKGVEFYIQDDLNDVAAKELYITDEVVNGKENTDLSEYFEDIIKNAESNNSGVKVGYYRLSNGDFVNPYEYKEGTIIGVVAFFDKDDNPVCIGLDFKKLPWLKNPFKNKISSDISIRAIEDMDGMKHTKDILNSKDYDPDNFEAVKYCTEYFTEGTEPGDWYLPAIGECVKIAKNVMTINVSLLKARLDTIDFSSWIWSSSECRCNSNSCAWICCVYDGDCNCYSGSRYVRSLCFPALRLLTKRKRSIHFNLLRKQFIRLVSYVRNGLIQ